MTQVALSSDHLFKKANTEELRWSPNVAEVVRVRGVIVRHVQTDAKRLHVQVGGSCLGLTGKVQSWRSTGTSPTPRGRLAVSGPCETSSASSRERDRLGTPYPEAQLRKDQ